MNQVIKPGLSSQILYDFLGDYILNNKLFITTSLYKKLVTNNTYAIFLQKIEPFYYKSKQFYCTRDITYNRFLTILRQLCKNFKLAYTSKIMYYNAGYENTLLIFV